MTVDPAASLRIWAVDMELAGRVFEVPPLPAADWLPVLVEGDLFAIIELMSESSDVDHLILAGEVTAEQLATALVAVVEQVTGRSLHTALATAQLAQQMWEVIGGELGRSGFRWDQQPIGAALDAVRYVAISALTRSKPELARKIESILDSEVSTSRNGRRRPNRAKAVADFEAMAGPKPGSAATGAVSADASTTAGRSSARPPRTPPPRQPHPRVGRSPAPKPPPGPPAESGRQASHDRRWDVAEPASGTGFPPPPTAR